MFSSTKAIVERIWECDSSRSLRVEASAVPESRVLMREIGNVRLTVINCSRYV
jgi:hypothetical protein